MLTAKQKRRNAERFDERWGELAQWNSLTPSQRAEQGYHKVHRMAIRQAQYDLMQLLDLNVWWDPIPLEGKYNEAQSQAATGSHRSGGWRGLWARLWGWGRRHPRRGARS